MNQHFPDALNRTTTFAELCEKIEGFSHDDASPTEQMQLVGALKLLAQDTIDKWKSARDLEAEAKRHLSMAKLRTQMNEVLAVTRQGRTFINWFKWFRA